MQRILGLVRRCMDDYGMIEAGDRVAVGVSGGKDSLLCLAALGGMREFYPSPFELEAVTLDMGFPGVDLSPVTAFCEGLGVRHTVVRTDIAEIVFGIRKEPHPCSLCANLRRGALHRTALSLGCNKVALGHHFDDAVETFWMSLIFEGRLSCFAPSTWLDRSGLTLIRPMLYVDEKTVSSRKKSLPVVANPCPANGRTQRQTVKETLAASEAASPGLKKKIFGAMKRLPLPGWEIKNGRR